MNAASNTPETAPPAPKSDVLSITDSSGMTYTLTQPPERLASLWKIIRAVADGRPIPQVDHPDVYWVVWSPRNGPPSYRHRTFADARKEADRLAEAHPGQLFLVLKTCYGIRMKGRAAPAPAAEEALPPEATGEQAAIIDQALAQIRAEDPNWPTAPEVQP